MKLQMLMTKLFSLKVDLNQEIYDELFRFSYSNMTWCLIQITELEVTLSGSFSKSQTQGKTRSIDLT